MPQAAAAVTSWIVKAAFNAAYAVGFSPNTAAAIAATTVKVVTATAKVAALASVNAVVANQNKPRPQGGLINLTINPNEPRRLQVGTRINGGVLADWYIRGSKNQYLYMIVYLGEGPMGRITKVYGGGREVYSTPIEHGTRTVIPNYRSGGDRLWITYYDGRPGQTADSYLVSQGVGWTSNHVGAGCAYAIVEAQWDSDNQTTPPQISFEMEGAKLYDRRKDTTAGGSGAHRANDPATWELSSNPAVALDHYLLGRYTGSVKTFGVGLAASDVPYAAFAARANLADENVNRKVSGTLKRYAANGFLFADRSYSDTIRDLCRAMNARPADFGGRIGIIDGEEKTPVMTLADADVIDGVPESYIPKRSWADLVSVVRGTYQNPAQLYQAGEYPRVTDAAWTAADGGSPKEATLDLEMETDVERAQRLATLFARRERRQAQLTGTYALRTIELEQGDWFIRAGGIFGAGKTFEVIDRVLDARTMTVTITAFEVDPADSAWVPSTAIDAPPAAIANTDTLQAMEVPSLTVTGVTLSGTAAELPAIRVQWTAPDDPRVRQIVVEAVPTAGGVPVAQTVDVGTAQVVFTNGITDDTAYLVRARFIGEYIPSAWTGNVAVTTLGDYSVGTATSVPWSGVTGTGRPADNADVTAANTAAGIAGQGAFATVNTAGYGSALLTGFGTLAPLGFTTLGTNVRQADGATAVTDATAITALGTAAAITGQGSFATLSAINDTLANANNLLRRSTGGLFSGDLAATVGARAGTNLFRTDGFTVLTQAEVRTPEGTAAAIAGQGSGATANNLAGLNATDNGNLTQSLSTSRRLVVSDFSADGRHWTTDFGGTPEAVADPVAEGYSDVASVGRVIRFNGFPRYLQPKGVITPMPGRRYAVIARVRTETAPTGGTITFDVGNINGLNTSFGHGDPTAPTEVIPNIPSNVAPAAGAWTLVGRVYQLTASPNAFNAYWRPRIDITATGSGGRAEVASFLILDVTDVPLGRILTGLLRADGTTPVTEALVVTGLGTAAAIAGQGWGATAAQFAADNQYPLLRMPSGLARNANFAEPFSGSARPPGWSEWIGGAGTFGPLTGLAGSGYLRTVAAGVEYDGITQIVSVDAGKKYLFAAEARRSSGSLAPTAIYIAWRDSSLAELSAQSFSLATIATTSGQISATPDGWNRWEIIATAPASAVYASIYALSVASFIGSVSSGTGIEWRLLDLIPLPLVSELRADRTVNNTAAAITGQGVFALGNYYEQSADPGAVPNGSFWFDTDTSELFVRRSGSWGKVATIANQNLTITRTNGFVKTRIGSGTITSDSVSFSSTGGSGTGYTYAHELFATYTTGPSPTISSASGSPITASASGAVPGDEVRGFIQTTATDSAGNRSTLTSPLALFCES